MTNFSDRATISGVKVTSEGYLVADAYAVRTGIQQYSGKEVGRPDLAVVNVYRPETEVFKIDSIKTFSHVPITNDHPAVPVTAENWRDYAVGETSDEVMRDGQRLRIPLVVKDAGAIQAIKDGKRELSAGYSCDILFESGLTTDGVAYDAIQTNIRANHIAIVQRGRAGSDFRIGDSWGATPLNDEGRKPMNMRTVIVDGITIETTEQGAQALDKVNAQVAKLNADIASLQTTINTKDGEIGELRVNLKQAEDSKLTGPMLDKAVADRALLIDTARKIAKDLKTDGLSDDDIRRAAVAAALGDEMVKDASDAVVLGMFKAASAGVGAADPVKQALLQQDRSPKADNGQAAYEQRIAGAWKTGRVA